MAQGGGAMPGARSKGVLACVGLVHARSGSDHRKRPVGNRGERGQGVVAMRRDQRLRVEIRIEMTALSAAEIPRKSVLVHTLRSARPFEG